ncbi:unnamed protein product [Victoria cruziana]
MLEKIGLPPKPSLRGNSWVVDASHCQGCCSQFTMFNRKHHCRRCGGLFCNTCTQQRMYLRGQGDSPVRICDPCKRLEEAARLEARHGYKSRATKGSSRPGKELEDELELILGTDGEQSLQSMQGSVENIVSDVLAAGTSSQKIGIAQGRELDIHGSSSINVLTSGTDEMGSTSPEDLRKRAQEEKRKYSILKREGKSDEALCAFKRGKELERQAASLELAVRKKRRNPSSTVASVGSDRANSQPSISSRKKSEKQGKRTDDLTTELKELGWSEADLHDVDKKQEKLTLEGELISLLKEVPTKSSPKKENNDADKAQVVSLKRNALKLKREGRLAEAKEELRKAKIIEKELEEKEFLGDDEDKSDDEIAALIRGMGDGNHDDTEIDISGNDNLDLSYIADVGGGIGVDGDFDVTDDDMNDPEIVAALRSFGWEEEPPAVTSSSVNLEALRNEVLSLKREAVKLKREGNNLAAMEQLKKAKQLEADLQQFESEGTNDHRTTTTRSSADTHEFSAYTEDTKTTKNLVSVRPSKNKSEIQKELLGLKRKALALRREGRVDEAEEALKACKTLEIQLDELENAKKMSPAVGKGSGFDDELHGVPGNSVLPEEGIEEVSEQDMHDPSLLSVLHTLGWKDEDDDLVTGPLESSNRVNHAVVPDNDTSQLEVKVRRSRIEIQKELLAVKRRYLALRRQGMLEEAEEELKKAKVLEDQMEEIDSSRGGLTGNMHGTAVGNMNGTDFGSSNVTKQQKHAGKIVDENSSFPALSSLTSTNVESGDGTASAVNAKAQRGRAEIQKELLGIKRRSLALRRQGKLEEAEEELKKAKILEAQIEEIDSVKGSHVLISNAGSDYQHLVLGSSDLTMQKDGAGLPAEETSKSVDRLGAPEVIKAMKGTDFKENNFAAHPGRKLETTVLMTSQNEQKMPKPFTGLHGSFDLLQEESMHVVALHQATQPSYVPDILTGEGWIGGHLTHGKANDGEALSSSNVVGGSPSAQLLQSSEPNATKEETDMKAGVSSGANFVGGVREHENTSGSFQTVAEVDSDAKNTSVKNIADQVSSQQEILAHKRRAVALKREGKLAEAKEELRRAKILEQGLGFGGDNRGSNPSSDFGRKQQTLSPSSTQGVTLPLVSASSDTSISPESKHQGQSHKSISGRDRFKLQQECLSHKRQALRLRREGRMEESEREFELAKALESQLEESPQGQPPAVGAEATEDVSVEDLLDPQLLSALQAIGMQGLELPTPAPQVRAAKGDIPKQLASSNVGSSKNPSQERSQLEEQIKAEKVQALHLKRAGKPAEAMDALRRAKLLEKKLNSLSS